jgi:DNA-binding NtrC family response regulator
MSNPDFYEKKIALVVEDNEEQRALVSCIMEESDLRVVQCTSADAAYAVMELTGPQVAVLFTDVRLPGVRSGVDLAHEVSRAWPDTDVIVTSGLTLDRPLPEGVTFLPKPWRALDILARVP